MRGLHTLLARFSHIKPPRERTERHIEKIIEKTLSLPEKVCVVRIKKEVAIVTAPHTLKAAIIQKKEHILIRCREEKITTITDLQ